MVAAGSGDMEVEPDAWEQSARIVEAFEAGADEATAELLREVARAIHDRAVDD